MKILRIPINIRMASSFIFLQFFGHCLELGEHDPHGTNINIEVVFKDIRDEVCDIIQNRVKIYVGENQ